MFIKKIVIQGFKSYLDNVVIDNLDPKVNILVGKNGAGKSNFFAALTFVLGDVFKTLRAEERQALIYQGSGEPLSSAFVEIHFDNSDHRFPTDRDTVSLRRTVSAKQDDYYLDKRHVPKQDVANMLESAGFSRSNPYYIMQQGRVNELAVMSPKERLALLKEVAGTRVYDERRAESVRTMTDTEQKRANIDKTIHYIEKRLEELQGETAELRAYEELDRQRRAVSFVIYSRQIADITQKLADIEEQERAALYKSKGKENMDGNTLGNQDSEHPFDPQEAQRALDELAQQEQLQTREKERLLHAQEHLQRVMAKLVRGVGEAEEKLARVDADREQMTAQAQQVNAQVVGARQELAVIHRDLASAQEKHQTLLVEMADANAVLDRIRTKQLVRTRFKSQRERDAWLDGEIRDLNAAFQDSEKKLQELAKEVKNLEAQNTTAREEQAQAEAKLQPFRTALAESHAQELELFSTRDALMQQRKTLWQEDATWEASYESAEQEMARRLAKWQSRCGYAVMLGLESVSKLVAEMDLGDKVYGPLYKLVRCPEAYEMAADVAAGGALLNVVVDTDETAERLLLAMRGGKYGKVTFMPLNRLRVRNLEDGSDEKESNMAQVDGDGDSLMGSNRLLDQVQVLDPRAQRAVEYVFGRTQVCSSMEVAYSVAQAHRVPCVTLDGDQVDSSGILTGGYRERSFNRFRLGEQLRTASAAVAKAQDERKRIRTLLDDIEQRLFAILSQLTKLEKERAERFDGMEQAQLAVRQATRIVGWTNNALEKRREQKQELEASAQASKKALEDRIAEKSATFYAVGDGEHSGLEPEDVKLLKETKARILQQEKKLSLSRKKLMSLESLQDRLQTALDTNWLMQQRSLASDLDPMRRASVQCEVEMLQDRLKSVTRESENVKRRLGVLTDQLAVLARRRATQSKTMESVKGKEMEAAVAMQDERKTLEGLLHQRTLLLRRKDTAFRRMHALGSLPTDQNQNQNQNQNQKNGGYQDMDDAKLMAILQETHDKLKGYAHVNKKALLQFAQFTDQRMHLSDRHHELEGAHEQISRLMQVLDERKDQAIIRTFKGVAKHFEEVFEMMVPSGSARLIMDEGEEDEQRNGRGVDRYDGTSIAVRFGERDQDQRMHQLSGGQKTLVALALVFAIQRCDPAPFYLMDEMDAALDPMYRSAVAQVIKQQSESAQYVVTTFKPELVMAGKRFYHIVHEQKVSKVVRATQNEALMALQDDEEE